MSVQLTATDLQFKYSRKAVPGDNPSLLKLDSHLFNGEEEYEVLNFINSFMSSHTVDEKPMSKAHGLKIERMLQKKPGDIRSQEKVKQWVKDNWGSHI
ncbi:hypothetical protein HXX01_05430 [Candidatus Nomurabacteria bacterium]|nr:hypothetical protein [Candidatus Nomurabacteria bacterium]